MTARADGPTIEYDTGAGQMTANELTLADLTDDEFYEVAKAAFHGDMEALFGDRCEEVLAQAELDMRDATVSAPAGLHW